MVKPYYAVKCNPEPWLISWLASYGAGFDCASVREISIVKEVESKAPIVYANPCKKRDDIIFGRVHGHVETTVIDSHEELDKLVELGWGGNSLLRISVDDSGSIMPFSAKFGADVGLVKHMAKYAKIKGQCLAGISFHVGSGCKDAQQYKKAILAAQACIDTLRAAGHHASILDIGGGFTNEDFIQSSQVINDTYSALDGITMIAEPGRFFAATSQDLFVQVIGKKPGKKGWRYTLDESLYGQFSCIPFDHARPKWIRVRAPGEAPRASTPAILYGRTCDSVDYIASADCEELMEGDWLWFPHMGAYTTVTSTEFNGFPKPPTHIADTHCAYQLPDPREFDEWPTNTQYVSAVKVPSS